MAFGTNYEDVGKGGQIPDGIYEVIVNGAKVTETKSFLPCILLPMVIRNDVDQPCKNQIIWDRQLKKKEPTAADQQCDGYSFKVIQSRSKAAGLPSGQQFEGLEDWCRAIDGKPMSVEVYQDGNFVKVRYSNETKHPEVKHVFKVKEEPADASASRPESFGDVSGFTAMEDSALPF